MKKKRILFLVIIIVVVLGLVIGLNISKLLSFFQNKEWEMADSVASVSIGNYVKTESTLNSVLLIGSNSLKAYSTEGKEKLDLFIPFQEVVSCSAGDYCVIGEKMGSMVYMISSGQKQWESEINGSIYHVYVNKNGYVAVTYKQSGYKSLVKVLSPSGSELFTSYLASTYAVDVAITNDNKTLAIAEVDTEGIHVVSSIKLIDMNQPENEKIQKVELTDNSLVIDIEYTDKNELLVRTDTTIEAVKGSKRIEICSFDYANTLYATVENHTNAVLVKKEENGLFEVKYLLVIYEPPEMDMGLKTYELYDIPKKIVARGNIVAVVMDKEILLINTNGKLEKKVNVSNNVKDVEILGNANMMAVIFRDRLELVKW